MVVSNPKVYGRLPRSRVSLRLSWLNSAVGRPISESESVDTALDSADASVSCDRTFEFDQWRVNLSLKGIATSGDSGRDESVEPNELAKLRLR